MNFGGGYETDGAVDASFYPEVFDDLVELSEVIRELHQVIEFEATSSEERRIT